MKKLFLAVACAVAALGSQAQEFPVKGRPIRVLIGFAAGGTADITGRLTSRKLSEELGVPVVVENKPGANGNLAAMEVVRAAPDGHTLFYTFSGTVAQNPHIMNVPYDPFKDFTPISMMVQSPQVLLVNSAVPARNVAELVAWCKANASTASFASIGYGSASHVFSEIFSRATGLSMIHIPYKGSGDAAKDLLAGNVQLMFAAAPSAVQLANTGRVRMVGIGADKRSRVLPDLPTMREQGIAGLELQGWQAYFGPPGMPAAIVNRLNAAMVKALADPAVREQITKDLSEPVGSSPAELARRMRHEYDAWGAAIKPLNIPKQ